MTVLIERKGDLFTSTAAAYAHGVNTAGLMGAGIAVNFKHAYPLMYRVYRHACKTGVLIPGDILAWTEGNRTVYNIASQDKPGRNARLEWFESGLIAALEMAGRENTDTIAMPRIGCGIGGLDWVDVRDIVEHYAEAQPVDIEVWSL